MNPQKKYVNSNMRLNHGSSFVFNNEIITLLKTIEIH